MVLVETAFCLNSLKYYIFYLTLYRMIRFVIPHLYQVGTSINRHTYIFTASSPLSTDVLMWRRFRICSRNRRHTLGNEFRTFNQNRRSFTCCDITGYVNLFSVHHQKLDEPHNSVTA